jgi:purine-binding chemotaxis protein CheW
LKKHSFGHGKFFTGNIQTINPLLILQIYNLYDITKKFVRTLWATKAEDMGKNRIEIAGKTTVTDSEILFLVFEASGITLGVEYGDTVEVIPYTNPVPVPNAPAYLAGIINYGGQICPVVSICGASGVAAAVITGRTRVVMTEPPDNSGSKIGIIADRFLGSARIFPGEIKAAGGAINGLAEGSISGTAGFKGSQIMIFKPFVFLKGLDMISIN